jgi:hypothetical protein
VLELISHQRYSWEAGWCGMPSNSGEDSISPYLTGFEAKAVRRSVAFHQAMNVRQDRPTP